MKKICFYLIVTMIAKTSCGQDLTFSQFYEKPLLRNPALAGVFDGDIRISAVFRNQWQSVTVPFQTGALSTEFKIPFNQNGDWITLGFEITHDVAGDIKLKRTQLLPVVNFHKSLNGNADDYLSAAFMAGPVTSQFDPTLLQLDDQFQNGSFNPNNPTAQVFSHTAYTYWDASTGLSYSSGFGEGARYYAGIGLFHFNAPKVSYYTNNSSSTLAPKFALNAGLTLPTGDANKVMFYADYFTQAGNEQFLGGLMYRTDLATKYDTDEKVSLDFGGFYRWNDSFIPVVKLAVYEVSFGISYDVNVSRLQTASQSRGGFEFTASYRARVRKDAMAGKVRCPKF